MCDDEETQTLKDLIEWEKNIKIHRENVLKRNQERVGYVQKYIREDYNGHIGSKCFEVGSKRYKLKGNAAKLD